VALSTSFTSSVKPHEATSKRELSAKRRRLHLLYLINDILHHVKVHPHDESIANKIQPFLIGLLGSAASFRNNPKHIRKIQDLLDIWDEKQYYCTEYIDELREATKIASETINSTADAYDSKQYETTISTKTPRGCPFVMPAVHGDQGTPWYDLPAGNLMPLIIPNSTRPINPSLLKPLQFVTGRADESLVTAVRDLLQDVSTIFGKSQTAGKEDYIPCDVDQLGQPILRDEIGGEALGGESYYGWSNTFCKKMKRRRNGFVYYGFDDQNRNSRSQSRSQSRSRSRSRSQNRSRSRNRSRNRSQSSSNDSRRLKRRQYSESDGDESRESSCDRSGHRQQSYGSSRSPPRYHDVIPMNNTLSRAPRINRSRSRSNGRASRQTHAAHYYSYSEPRLGPLNDTSSGPLSSGEGFTETSHPAMPSDQVSMNEYSGPPSPTQQPIINPSNHQLVPGALHNSQPLLFQYQRQWPPLPPPPHTLPYSQQNQQSIAWPPPTQPQHGSQQWQPYGQQPAGSGGWPSTAQRGGNGRGGCGDRGRGAQGVVQQQPYSRGSGYTGYAGGRGW
jgi:CID domain